jgi:hypothetical protein
MPAVRRGVLGSISLTFSNVVLKDEVALILLNTQLTAYTSPTAWIQPGVQMFGVSLAKLPARMA